MAEAVFLFGIRDRRGGPVVEELHAELQRRRVALLTAKRQLADQHGQLRALLQGTAPDLAAQWVADRRRSLRPPGRPAESGRRSTRQFLEFWGTHF